MIEPKAIPHAQGRPFRLLRPLPELPTALRWLALDETSQLNHVLYDLSPLSARLGPQGALRLLERRTHLRHPHVLPIDDAWADPATGRVWACSPYTGNPHGLVRLLDLARAKGGTLGPAETERAIEQILDGLSALHASGILPGRLAEEALLVDRHGAIQIELHGLGLDPPVAQAEAARDEIAAVANLAHLLLTGLRADEVRLPLGRIVPRRGAIWDAWVHRAMDPLGGFTSASEALDAIRPTPAIAPVHSPGTPQAITPNHSFSRAGSAASPRPPVITLARFAWALPKKVRLAWNERNDGGQLETKNG